jgi:hypothetical protein
MSTTDDMPIDEDALMATVQHVAGFMVGAGVAAGIQLGDELGSCWSSRSRSTGAPRTSRTRRATARSSVARRPVQPDLPDPRLNLVRL